MARYIDADKVMEEINRIGGHNLCEWETIGVKALIDRQPTADVVEVVRCKGCVYFKNDTDYCKEHKKGYCEWDKTIKSRNHFCSYGEKALKEGESK